ncbi:MAG: AarF/ABC1/UbiB kinase family protein [Alphaproteobacteria bacterium]|nr:AarF/ABC1/UbiB kinase family protein [Alphaproteobacteria bacterium]
MSAPKPRKKASSDDRNRVGKRVRRYAQVTGAVGGLAARLAGARYLGVSIDKDRHAVDLKNALGGLKGPLMKVAQLLSTIPDALPESYARELAQLQSNAPSMGWNFVRRRMAAELGDDWEKLFKNFEREAAKAASLGQVHRATARDGTALACKLQYPDMRSVVEADLAQLRIVLGLFERYDRAVSTKQIHAELSERLREELDYRREAKHMALYRLMLAKEEGVHVPDSIAALSTDRLLTMTWLDGQPLAELEKAPAAKRNRVAQNLFRAWYVSFYEYGVIHGDPHLGNYSARPDGAINLLDFGCIRVFPPSFVQGVIDLYKALRDGDEELALEAYRIWGFKDLRREVIDVLNIWARFVYAPLLEDKTRRIQEKDGGLYGATVAAKVHNELRRIGGVEPPREFVLMDRAAVGLGSVFLRLKAEINWYRLFHDLIGDFDRATLAKRQAKALKQAGLDGSAPKRA